MYKKLDAMLVIISRGEKTLMMPSIQCVSSLSVHTRLFFF